jgi:hypothetical protein
VRIILVHAPSFAIVQWGRMMKLEFTMFLTIWEMAPAAVRWWGADQSRGARK